jgi:hypothetical protein
LLAGGLLFVINAAALPLYLMLDKLGCCLGLLWSRWPCWPSCRAGTYLIPLLVFTSQGRFTLPLAVANFQTKYAQNTASVLAFAALSMLPALGCFIFAERATDGGLTGVVKG